MQLRIRGLALEARDVHAWGAGFCQSETASSVPLKYSVTGIHVRLPSCQMNIDPATRERPRRIPIEGGPDFKL